MGQTAVPFSEILVLRECMFRGSSLLKLQKRAIGKIHWQQ